MEQNIKKIKRSLKIYPIVTSCTGDLMFFVPIDTLFLTLVKGLSVSQISAITMISLFVCIVFQKIILVAIKKIGNVNAIKLGIVLILIASLLLTFGKTFIAVLIYKCLAEVAFMFLSMDKIVLRRNLKCIDKEKEYYRIRNKSKILYSIITMFTALIAGYLFNIDNYLPMYLSLTIYVFMLGMSSMFYESKLEEKQEDETKTEKKVKITSLLFLTIISNAVFYSIIKLGQNNSKLFMQYDFQEFLSMEMIAYYITTIVFISRIARIVGNIVFVKIYKKIKDKMSIILTVCLSMAFLLLIIGHLLNIAFIYKVIIMASGFFLILATRDSFQVYIEDVALDITNKEEQQKIMIDIEVYRKIGTLILSAIFTLILIKYELIVIIIILFLLSILEIFINQRLCKKLKAYKCNKKTL